MASIRIMGSRVLMGSLMALGWPVEREQDEQ